MDRVGAWACEIFHEVHLPHAADFAILRTFWGEQPCHWSVDQWHGTFFVDVTALGLHSADNRACAVDS